jgi:hypothetical protein
MNSMWSGWDESSIEWVAIEIANTIAMLATRAITALPLVPRSVAMMSESLPDSTTSSPMPWHARNGKP